MDEKRLIDAMELSTVMDKAIDDAPIYIQATVQQMIDYAPTIEPPVVHGEWKPAYHLYGAGDLIADEFHCSECNIYSKYDTNYCPNCGAKMDKGEAE